MREPNRPYDPATDHPFVKGGADRPMTRYTERRAAQLVDVGETYDFEFTPSERGEYRFSVALPVSPGGRRPTRGQVLWTQRVIVP